MKRLGLIVNPIAGMGGSCGLKGTDGKEILKRARELGAQPQAPARVVAALGQLARVKGQIQIFTVAGEMGEREARLAGFEPEVVLDTNGTNTTSEDTRRAVRELCRAGVDLILFGGGDGTARDISSTVAAGTVCLGIPAGVKIHSGVFGVSPRNTGELAALYLEGCRRELKHAEVMDIDEDAFREGRLSAELYGYLQVPADQVRVQSYKAGRAQSDENALSSIAFYLAAHMDPSRLYAFGTGSTVHGIMQRLAMDGTLLGVDVAQGFELVAKDVNEQLLLELLGSPENVEAEIIVTVIGGQGYIFGRGNQQFSPSVIERVGRDNIMVVATKSKIASLEGRPLLVDTGSEATDAMLSGYTRVLVGYDEQIVVRVSG